MTAGGAKFGGIGKKLAAIGAMHGGYPFKIVLGKIDLSNIILYPISFACQGEKKPWLFRRGYDRISKNSERKRW
jgi:hypothetical protein